MIIHIGQEKDMSLAINVWQDDQGGENSPVKDHFVTVSGLLSSSYIDDQDFNKWISFCRKEYGSGYFDPQNISQWNVDDLPPVVLLAEYDSQREIFKFQIIEGIERLAVNTFTRGGFSPNDTVVVCRPEDTDLVAGLFKGDVLTNHLSGKSHPFVSHPSDSRFIRSYRDMISVCPDAYVLGAGSDGVVFDIGDQCVAKIVYHSDYDVSLEEPFVCDKIQEIKSPLVPKMRGYYVGTSCAVIRHDIAPLIGNCPDYDVRKIASALNDITLQISPGTKKQLKEARDFILQHVDESSSFDGFRGTELCNEIFNDAFLYEIQKLAIEMKAQGIDLRDLSLDNLGRLDGKIVIRDFSRCKPEMVPSEYNMPCADIKTIEHIRLHFVDSTANNCYQLD